MMKSIIYILLLFVCCNSLGFKNVRFYDTYTNRNVYFLTNPYNIDSINIYLPKKIKIEYMKKINLSFFKYKSGDKFLSDEFFEFFDNDSYKYFPIIEIRSQDINNNQLNLILYRKNNISIDDLNKILENNSLPKKEKGFRDTVFIGDINNLKKDNPLFFEKLNSKNDSLFIYYVEKGKSKFELEKFRINW